MRIYMAAVVALMALVSQGVQMASQQWTRNRLAELEADLSNRVDAVESVAQAAAETNEAQSVEILRLNLGLESVSGRIDSVQASIPTNNAQLVNGAEYVTKSVTNGLATAAALKDVADSKQDALPYPTNDIPHDAVAGALSDYYTKEQTDDAIDSLAAYYITANAQGDAFATLAALTNATTYFSGGVERTPTRNDYAVVLADEAHGSGEWRYIYAVHEGATAGQWEAQYPIETNDYEGLSNKPQIGGTELFGNKTAAELGLLPSDTAELTGNRQFVDAVEQVSPPADTSDCVKTNDLPGIINASNGAFSNAVLSVGLGIDTNTVATINALIESESSPLPSGGTTTLGGLLVALAVAVAALSRKKQEKITASGVLKGDGDGGVSAAEAADIPELPASKIQNFAEEVAAVSPPTDISGKLDSTAAAPDFKDSVAYAAGEYVTRNGQLYRFTSAHSGAWTGTDVSAEDMTTPDATFDIMADGSLRLVEADGNVAWQQGYGRVAPEVSSGSITLESGKINYLELAADVEADTTITLVLPPILAGDSKTKDFGLDVANLSEHTLTLQISPNQLNVAFAAFVQKGDDLQTLGTVAAGEYAELYFTQSKFTKVVDGTTLPVYRVYRQTVEDGGAQS